MNDIRTYYDPYLHETFLSCRHESGLRIRLVPKQLTTSYAILGVGYGSMDSVFDAGDGQGSVKVPDGIAHYLEHKMFENADGSDSLTVFSALGANANAFTTNNLTAYLFSTTSGFDASLEELLRFVYVPYFTPETVEKERGIISEEIEMYEDDPYSALHYGLMELLYRDNPVRINVAGTVASVSTITAEHLYRCYHAFYRPENMVLSVSGNVTMAQITAICDKILPHRDELPAVTRAAIIEENSVFKERGEREMRVSLPLFRIGIKDVPVSDGRERLKRTIAAGMLMEALFGVSSECYNRMYADGTVSGMSCGYDGAESFAFAYLSGECREPDVVLKEILSTAEKAKREGIAHEVLSRIRKVTAAEYVKNFDSTEEIAQNALFMTLDGTEPCDYIPLLHEIDDAYMAQVLRTLFREDSVAMMTVIPQKEEIR